MVSQNGDELFAVQAGLFGASVTCRREIREDLHGLLVESEKSSDSSSATLVEAQKGG